MARIIMKCIHELEVGDVIRMNDINVTVREVTRYEVTASTHQNIDLGTVWSFNRLSNMYLQVFNNKIKQKLWKQDKY